MEIGQRIKKIAEEKRISAKEVGKMIGHTRQSIYDIYAGKVSINVKNLEKIAIALDEPIINFFTEQQIPQKKQAIKTPAAFLSKAFANIEGISFAIDATYFKNGNSEDALKIAAQIYLASKIDRIASILEVYLKQD